jgi:homoserine kinase
VGNVGPGFDVLGLAVCGVGDKVSVELWDGPHDVIEAIEGRDAALIPLDPTRNAATLAARAALDALGGKTARLRVRIDKGLPASGGMGGSAASSVAGALAAFLALGRQATPQEVMRAALVGEAAVAGRHLDNIAPCVLGGLTLVRSVEPMDVAQVPVARTWYVALVTPAIRVDTRNARALLPVHWDRDSWVRQMANTAALVAAFITGDEHLLSRALDDGFAEPRRATLIPHFAQVKHAALAQGALGCSISGAGPTVFALCANESVADACGNAMKEAFAEVPATTHVGAVDRKGACAS